MASPPPTTMGPGEGIELMKARNARMHSAESVAHGRQFNIRSDDIMCCTYPKCGTTWCTQILHQIRCAHAGIDGESFDEITEVVPWDVLALDCGLDLDGEQVAKPRLYKSHESATTVRRGGRYVVVVRDPTDVFNSFYEFLPAYLGIERGAITPEEFADAIFAGASHSGGFGEHYLSWFDARAGNPENVLMLAYEDMKSDLGAVVDRIAAFMRIELDAASRALVLERSSFAYMRNNPKFDDHLVRGKVAKQIGLPPDSNFTVGKVRDGGGVVGDGARKQPLAVREAIQAKWSAQMVPRGFASYDDFRAALHL